MQDFKKLALRQKAHLLVLAVYRSSSSFPRNEQFELTRQMRRSAASIAMNIAEGCGSGSRRDFARFLTIAAGSASELEYQVLLCRDLGFVPPEVHGALTDQVQEAKRMVSGLLKRLRTETGD